VTEVNYDDLTIPDFPLSHVTRRPSREEWSWFREGMLMLPGFLPDPLIGAYCAAWKRLDLGNADPYDVTPYRRVPEMLDLCCYGPLSWALQDLIGEPMAVHLNLIGWTSTERDWHADSYLSPPEVAPYYAAVWFALADVDPRSGPFEYVPGSHRWGQIDQARVRALIAADRRDLPSWPRDSEAILTPAIEKKIAAEGAEVRQFLGKRGDVLIWHSRLIHRGSRPQVPGLERRALIAHFSSISRRPDMPAAIPVRRATEDGTVIDGWQFPL
jgi:phytanoyl-CoA dioxygenase PhyH